MTLFGIFSRDPDAPGAADFDLLAHPDLAAMSARDLADLPLWPAPEAPCDHPSGTGVPAHTDSRFAPVEAGTLRRGSETGAETADGIHPALTTRNFFSHVQWSRWRSRLSSILPFRIRSQAGKTAGLAWMAVHCPPTCRKTRG
ncbi:hypothetical protein [Chthonobacter rhizosphaerae]|uniref:hypothetical protein n=1 Tax=Chthonobacter rhizosphaerae TaxID=2735553 RepID=UPI0015EEEE3D|nr:hypothetical protein [Chthonobacter rhizosphaerae]